MAGRLYLNGNPIKGGGRGTGTVPCFILYKNEITVSAECKTLSEV